MNSGSNSFCAFHIEKSTSKEQQDRSVEHHDRISEVDYVFEFLNVSTYLTIQHSSTNTTSHQAPTPINSTPRWVSPGEWVRDSRERGNSECVAQDLCQRVSQHNPFERHFKNNIHVSLIPFSWSLKECERNYMLQLSSILWVQTKKSIFLDDFQRDSISSFPAPF